MFYHFVGFLYAPVEFESWFSHFAVNQSTSYYVSSRSDQCPFRCCWRVRRGELIDITRVGWRCYFTMWVRSGRNSQLRFDASCHWEQQMTSSHVRSKSLEDCCHTLLRVGIHVYRAKCGLLFWLVCGQYLITRLHLNWSSLFVKGHEVLSFWRFGLSDGLRLICSVLF